MRGLLDRARRSRRKLRGPPHDFRVTALISVRTCEDYLDRCFEAIRAQDVDICVIDNDANAATRAIIDAWRGRGIVHVEHLPYPGYFDWTGILRCKERLARTLDSDWFVLWDSDEIREPSNRYTTLREGLKCADAEGCDAVNFSEFVFLPIDRGQDFAGRDYVAGLDRYYFLQAKPNHRLTAWKKTQRHLHLEDSGGHTVAYSPLQIFPEPFVLRHYLFLSWAHGVRKYMSRTYADAELAKGWSAERARTTEKTLRLPGADETIQYRHDNVWNRSAPRARHLCFDYGDEAG